MSFNRNKDEDHYNTRQILNKDPGNFSDKNWLGHSGKCAKIDVMLLQGGSFAELLASGRKKNSVHSHLNHLKTDHGLSIEKKDDGVFIFSLCHDSGRSNRTKEETGQKYYLPTKDDCETAIRQLYDENIQARTEQVLDRIEKNVTSKGMVLKSNWRMITEENMKIWSN